MLAWLSTSSSTFLRTLLRPRCSSAFLAANGAATSRCAATPRDVGSILMPLDRGQRFERFTLHPKFKAYEGWTEEEVAEDLSSLPEQRRIAADRRLRSETDLEANIADITHVARKELAGAAAAPKQYRADKAARGDERRQARQEEAWTKKVLVSTPEPATGLPVAEAVQPAGPSDAKLAQPSHMDVLRAARSAGRRGTGGQP